MPELVNKATGVRVSVGAGTAERMLASGQWAKPAPDAKAAKSAVKK